jgi:hypothetical protein
MMFLCSEQAEWRSSPERAKVAGQSRAHDRKSRVTSSLADKHSSLKAGAFANDGPTNALFLEQET